MSVLAAGLDAALAFHWHPVCTLAELTAAAPHPVAVRLLGRDLAVARLDTGVAAFVDRCVHRSTRLSIGCVEGDRLRCAYHGWAYGIDGACVEIPSMPDGPIPTTAIVERFSAEERHGLVWVRLVDGAGTFIPPCPAFDDPTMKVLEGAPYTWPVAAPRRVENFVDLAHFAFVHDGSLGRRDEPVPPIPDVRREGWELQFHYDPPALPPEPDAAALVGASRYRMPIPCTVDIEFLQPDGARRRLWMTASPVDDATCRSFWFVARTDDLDGDAAAHLTFQDRILREDEPVVSNQVPPQMLLDRNAEVSVRTDKVSNEYRRWLKELATAAPGGALAYGVALGTISVDPTPSFGAGSVLERLSAPLSDPPGAEPAEWPAR